jgi:curved DNA-binding protein CbpA
VDRQDLYRTLQVDSEADVDVIRAAYRVLAARNHPDVGGSSEQMSIINQAWNTLSNPIARSAYDRERRIRINGEKWDAYGNAPNAAQDRSTGTILEFGRYAGWTIAEIARRDPDYLEWLARTLIGRRYRAEIDEILTKLYPVPAAPPAQQRRSRFARA